MAAQTSEKASPPASPIPQPPDELLPGARATALQNAFAKALEATLNKCSFENFASCFPTPAEYRPQTLMMFHKEFTSRLGQVCLTEFEAILRDRNVVQLLNALDRLVHDARTRKESAEAESNGAPAKVPIAPHTLPPSQLVNAHLAPFLTDMRVGIMTETTALEASNSKMMERIKQQRQEMESLVGGLEGVVQDLEKSAALLQGDEVVGLTAEVKMVEEELKT